jgi:signal transduction histidine kinase
MIQGLKQQADQQNNELMIAMGGGIPDLIYSDLSRLRIILMNLLTNAIKFTVNGQIQITCNYSIDKRHDIEYF